MRVRGLALLGLVVGAFVGLSQPAIAANANAGSMTKLDQFFSSDGPESLHEAKNQGTNDEPKAWPEATAWLHAQLSDAERDFLLLTTSGPIDPTADYSGGFTTQQATDSTATVTVTLRFTFSQPPTNFATNLRNDLIASLSSSSAATISTVSVSPAVIGTLLYSTATFTISFNSVGSQTAVAQWRALASAFGNSASSLRLTNTFQDIDLTYFVKGVYVPGTTLPPTTGIPSTGPTPTGTQFPCGDSATPCLNSGTCIKGQTATSYTCGCAAGFIGTRCEFSLFGAAGRRSTHAQGNGRAIPRGKSVARPNAVKPHSA